VRRFFAPAEMLLGLLPYPQKIALVALMLMLPLGFVTKGYVDIQRGQVAFSLREHDGVVYLRPLLTLMVLTVGARHAAVLGADPAGAGVTGATGAVDAVNTRYGATFETTRLWDEARAALGDAASVREPAAALVAYNKATAALIAVINRVSDRSNLTLDPDLDSYYVMDALVFRLPILLDVTGQAVDEALVSIHGTGDGAEAVRFDLAVDSGALLTTRASVVYDLQTALANTDNPHLLATRSDTAAMLDAIKTALDQATAGGRIGHLDELEAATVGATIATIATLNTALLTALGDLLDVRIDGFNVKAYRVEATAIVAVLLVLYLLIGFYRSARPLRRMVAGLHALAGGDLTGLVMVETRDEVGQMAVAFNRANARVRQAVEALHANAAGVAGCSAELSQVSRLLSSAAEDTSHQAAVVSSAGTEVARSVNIVAGGADDMNTAIAEIGKGAAEAARVAAEAVAAAHSTDAAVGRLGCSSAEIGDVITVITRIAKQSNLLALNASIEAARADEAGKGFGVVASQVRELSQESARAAQDIIGLVKAIQTDVQLAATAIGQIGEIIGRINEIQVSIVSAVEEQAVTTGETSRNVAAVAIRSASIAEGLGAVADRAEETSSSATVTERVALELARTADDLGAIVAQFRTAVSSDLEA
jgi:methyl-accepting chemotaxis protein